MSEVFRMLYNGGSFPYELLWLSAELQICLDGAGRGVMGLCWNEFWYAEPRPLAWVYLWCSLYPQFFIVLPILLVIELWGSYFKDCSAVY